MTDLAELSIAEASSQLERGETTAAQLTSDCLERIAARRDVNAFITVNEQAEVDARASDARRAAGEPRSPLDGIPIALKDLIVTKELRTTAGSRILGSYVPPYDGAMPERLAAAGAVVVGKTNLDEFAMGSSNEFSSFGPVRNPWNVAHVPGGSSGGSAAAVAAGQALGALGTDTGGSIRQPASLCGIYGLKPTYGRVSRFGTIAFASSLDQVGPFGRSAHDVALMLQTIAGHDPRDATSANVPVPDYVAEIAANRDGPLKIGVPREYFAEGLQDDVRSTVQAALDVYRESGAELVDVSLPHTEYALSTYYIICTAEASSNLARYDGIRYGARVDAPSLAELYARSRHAGFGPEVQRRILLGTYVLSAGYYDAYYGRAQRVRTLIKEDFQNVFETVDILATPTSPTTAFAIGDKVEDPLTMYLADVHTLPASLAGVPGLSVPAGLASDGLPVGIQLLAPWFQEATLLCAASRFEQRTSHHRQRPQLD